MTVRKADAVWRGSLREGAGEIALESGAFRGPYTFRARFESGKETNPEELLGAAHAGCFAMASSAEIEKLGVKAASVDVTCTITMEPVDGKPTLTSSHLVAKVKVPGGDRAKLQAAVEGAKAGCPISRVLNLKVSLDATYEV